MRKKIITLLIICMSLSSCDHIDLEDFSKAHVEYQFVNLKKATERKKTMDAQLDLAGVSYKALDAVLGKALSDSDFENLKSNNIYDRINLKDKALLPGELGVYLSTIQKSLPTAIANKDTITVTFEDDVVIPYDIDIQFRQALTAAPNDWDILYLGCYQNYFVAPPHWNIIGPYMPQVTDEAKNYKYPLCPTDESNRVYNTPWIQLDGSCVAGMYAYALRPQSAAKVLNKLVPIKQAVDRALTDLIAKGELRAYCLKPELVRVNTTIPSTIR